MDLHFSTSSRRSSREILIRAKYFHFLYRCIMKQMSLPISRESKKAISSLRTISAQRLIARVSRVCGSHLRRPCNSNCRLDIFRSSDRQCGQCDSLCNCGASAVPIEVYRLKGLSRSCRDTWIRAPTAWRAHPGATPSPRWPTVESRARDCRRARITRVSPLSCARDVRRSVTMWSSMKYYSLFLYLSPCPPLSVFARLSLASASPSGTLPHLLYRIRLTAVTCSRIYHKRCLISCRII